MHKFTPVLSKCYFVIHSLIESVSWMSIRQSVNHPVIQSVDQSTIQSVNFCGYCHSLHCSRDRLPRCPGLLGNGTWTCLASILLWTTTINDLFCCGIGTCVKSIILRNTKFMIHLNPRWLFILFIQLCGMTSGTM